MPLTDFECLYATHAFFNLTRAYETRIARGGHSPDSELSIQDIGFLVVVGHNAPIASRKLAEVMGITPGTTSIYVQRLVEKNLLNRQQSLEDRRIWWISLSAEGQETFREIMEITIAATRGYLSVLNEEEQRTLYSSLEKITHQAAVLDAGVHGVERIF